MNLIKLNIFGSTGNIGSKALKILKSNFLEIKINLLVANQNYNKLINQSKLYNPKYICLLDEKKYKHLKNELKNSKIKIIHPSELNSFILQTNSDLTLLSISGYNALNFFSDIHSNTKLIGIVNKECIVSAGHLLNKFKKKFDTNYFPLDSEHYSLFNFFNNLNEVNYQNINKIYLTASGGPFYKRKFRDLSKITLQNAINHPKWKMGYKNSIDSATLANKCLEIIEAKYLFDIPYNKLDISIHPEALIHSVIEYNNYTSVLNYFYHDMSIPLYNFFNFSLKKDKFDINNNKFSFNNFNQINFDKPSVSNYPILKIFKNIDKYNPIEIIKFNCANEFAVDLFVKKMIKFNEICKIIDKSMNIHLNFNVNSLKNIVNFQKEYVLKLQCKFNKK